MQPVRPSPVWMKRRISSIRTARDTSPAMLSWLNVSRNSPASPVQVVKRTRRRPGSSSAFLSS